MPGSVFAGGIFEQRNVWKPDVKGEWTESLSYKIQQKLYSIIVIENVSDY